MPLVQKHLSWYINTLVEVPSVTVYVLVDFVSFPPPAPPESPNPFLASSNLLENGESAGFSVTGKRKKT